MNSVIVNNVDLFNPIGDNMPKIIEYFVKFYGEKYRNQIEKTLNNLKIIIVGGNSLSNSPKKNLKCYYNDKIFQIEKSFIDSLKTKDFSKFYYIPFDNMDKIKNLLNSTYYNEVIFEIISTFNPKIIKSEKYYNQTLQCNNDEQQNNLVNSWLSDESSKKELTEIFDNIIKFWEENYSAQYNQLISEKEEKMELLQEYDSAIISSMSKNDDYNKDFVFQILSQNKIFKISNLNELINDKSFVNDFLEIIEKFPIFEMSFDRSRFIKVFNQLGFNLGTSLQEYTNNMDIIKFFDNQELKEKYTDFKKEVKKQEIINNRNIMSIINELVQMGFYGINDIVNDLVSFSYNSSCLAYVTFVQHDEGFTDLCVLPTGETLCNHTVIHEFNHIIETNIIFHDGKYVAKCGYDILRIDSTKDKFEKDNLFSETRNSGKREAELFNEVINDYLSKKICKLMERDNFQIGLNDEIDSSYSIGFVLLEDFIEENLDIIIESRFSPDINALANKIGKNNLNRLTKLTDKFLKFSIFTIADFLKLMTSKYNLTKTELKNFLSNGNLPKVKVSKTHKEILDCFIEMNKIKKSIEEFKNCQKDNLVDIESE